MRKGGKVRMMQALLCYKKDFLVDKKMEAIIVIDYKKHFKQK
jgi:hypothetical protein